jgi:hypothetical protein
MAGILFYSGRFGAPNVAPQGAKNGLERDEFGGKVSSGSENFYKRPKYV